MDYRRKAGVSVLCQCVGLDCRYWGAIGHCCIYNSAIVLIYVNGIGVFGYFWKIVAVFLGSYVFDVYICVVN